MVAEDQRRMYVAGQAMFPVAAQDLDQLGVVEVVLAVEPAVVDPLAQAAEIIVMSVGPVEGVEAVVVMQQLPPMGIAG